MGGQRCPAPAVWHGAGCIRAVRERPLPGVFVGAIYESPVSAGHRHLRGITIFCRGGPLCPPADLWKISVDVRGATEGRPNGCHMGHGPSSVTAAQ